MNDIYFKRANIEDWKLLEKIEKAAASPFFQGCIDEAQYKKYLTESQVFFIMAGDDAIGSISYKKIENETMLINGLTVLPDRRRRGIARKAMKKLLADLGNQNIALYVHPENTPALLIYLRLNFVITDWKDNVLGNGQPRLLLRKYAKEFVQTE